MKIISCHIENFGKLHNYSINFSEGVNIICKENGWGKTTLATFIKVMFYGFEGKGKKSIEENERNRYKPWQEGIFGGQLMFDLNGIQYQVIRIFKNKPSEDTFELRDAKTNKLYSYDGKTPNSLGERIFKVDCESFIRTAFISHNDLLALATDNINSKITNLIDNTDDMNNFESACTNLTKIINNLNKNKASSIPKREAEINQLSRVIQDNDDVPQLINECQNKLQVAEKNYAELKSELQQNNSLIHNSNNQFVELPIWTKIGIVTAVLGIIATIFISATVAKIASCVVSIVIIVALLMTYKEPNQNKIEAPIENVLHITEDMERLKDDINNYNRELESLRLKYEETESHKAALNELKLKQTEELKKHEHLIKAREKLIIAKKNITAEYSEPLLKSFIKYYKFLTNDNTKSFSIDDNFNLELNELNGQRDINIQSSGYKDLIWICSRIALIEAMYKDDSPVLIMDDPFTNLDDEKIIEGMKLLRRIAENYQIIYFTCSDSRS